MAVTRKRGRKKLVNGRAGGAEVPGMAFGSNGRPGANCDADQPIGEAISSSEKVFGDGESILIRKDL